MRGKRDRDALFRVLQSFSCDSRCDSTFHVTMKPPATPWKVPWPVRRIWQSAGRDPAIPLPQPLGFSQSAIPAEQPTTSICYSD